MGADYSTIQLKNRNQAKSKDFKETLKKYFGTKGFVSSTEENSEFSCWFSFSKNGGWITFGATEYDEDPTEIYKSVQEIAKYMNTDAVVTEVWDSDFFVLNRFGEDETQRDTIVAGTPPEDSFLTEGDP